MEKKLLYKKVERIKVGSIVMFRSRKWKYVSNENLKCVLEILETEKPLKLDDNKYVTRVKALMESLVLIQSA